MMEERKEASVRRSVWVVDDEPLIRAAMMAVLAEIGYETRGFGSAEELYVSLVDGRGIPDLLVLDQMLPDEEAERLEFVAPVVRKPFDFRDFVAAVQARLPTAASDVTAEGVASSS